MREKSIKKKTTSQLSEAAVKVPSWLVPSIEDIAKWIGKGAKGGEEVAAGAAKAAPEIKPGAAAADDAAAAAAGGKTATAAADELSAKLAPEVRERLAKTSADDFTAADYKALGLTPAYKQTITLSREAGMPLGTPAEIIETPWYKNVASVLFRGTKAAGNATAAVGGAIGSGIRTLADVAFVGIIASVNILQALDQIATLDPNDPDYKRRIYEIIAAQVGKFGVEMVATYIGLVISAKLPYSRGTGLGGSLKRFATRLLGMIATGGLVVAAGKYVNPKIKDIVDAVSDDIFGPLDRTPGAGSAAKATHDSDSIFDQTYRWAISHGFSKSGALRLAKSVQENPDLQKTMGFLKEDGASREDISDAITRRMMSNGMAGKLLKAHGLDAVIDAISDVTAMHAGATELGSSDVSIMVQQVLDNLGGLQEADSSVAAAPLPSGTNASKLRNRLTGMASDQDRIRHVQKLLSGFTDQMNKLVDDTTAKLADDPQRRRELQTQLSRLIGKNLSKTLTIDDILSFADSLGLDIQTLGINEAMTGTDQAVGAGIAATNAALSAIPMPTAKSVLEMIRGPGKFLLGRILLGVLPGIGVATNAYDAWNDAWNGDWKNAAISVAEVGLNIGQIFGFMAGGGPGIAAFASLFAAELYKHRAELYRLYYGIEPNDQTDPQIKEHMDELQRQIIASMSQWVKELLYNTNKDAAPAGSSGAAKINEQWKSDLMRLAVGNGLAAAGATYASNSLGRVREDSLSRSKPLEMGLHAVADRFGKDVADLIAKDTGAVTYTKDLHGDTYKITKKGDGIRVSRAYISEAGQGPSILVVGDQTAAALGQALKAKIPSTVVVSKPGADSTVVANMIGSQGLGHSANLVIVSVGTNNDLRSDAGRAALNLNLGDMRQFLDADNIIWVLPNIPMAKQIISQVAEENGDRTIPMMDPQSMADAIAKSLGNSNIQNESPAMGDIMMLELADGRMIRAPIVELRGNSLVLDLDETASAWLDESPTHDDLKIGQGSEAISKTAEVWNSLIDRLVHDTPSGWAELFVALEPETGRPARGQPRRWANIWRQQHEALGDNLTRGDALEWAQEVEDHIDGRAISEGNIAGVSKIKSTLGHKDPAMLAVWMKSHSGTKGEPVKKFAKKLASQAGLGSDAYWGKIKKLVQEGSANDALLPVIITVLGKKMSPDPSITDTANGYMISDMRLNNLKGNEELELEQALFNAGYDIKKVTIGKSLRSDWVSIDLVTKPRKKTDEARPDVLGLAESPTDPYSVEKRYYIVRKDKPPAPTPGIQGFHSVSAAEDHLKKMKNQQDYSIVAIDSPKKDVRADEGKLDAAKTIDRFFGGMAESLVKSVIRRAGILAMQGRHDEAELMLNRSMRDADPEAAKKVSDAVRQIKPVTIGTKTADTGALEKSQEHNDWLDNKFIPWVMNSLGLNEAKYQGREVQLGKPIRTNTGEGGKFKVYVRDPKTGNIKMVRFGDTTGLTIKRDDPKRRRNFRARHHCDNPGPRTKARYWSCRMWTKKPVGKILKGK